MKNKLEESDLTIISIPTFVEFECPHCNGAGRMNYEDMLILSDYPGDWCGEIIECTECEGEIIVNNVYWE